MVICMFGCFNSNSFFNEEVLAFLKRTIETSIYYLNFVFVGHSLFFIANAIEVLYHILVMIYLQFLKLKILPTKTRNESIVCEFNKESLQTISFTNELK